MLQSRGPIRAPTDRMWPPATVEEECLLPFLPSRQQAAEMTAGAANCEMNWTCDPAGGSSIRPRGDAIIRAHIWPWQKNNGARRRWPDPRSVFSTRRLQTRLSFAWLLWLCGWSCETCRRLLAPVRGIILESKWICSQIQDVRLMVILPHRGRASRPQPGKSGQHPEPVYTNNPASLCRWLMFINKSLWRRYQRQRVSRASSQGKLKQTSQSFSFKPAASSTCWQFIC